MAKRTVKARVGDSLCNIAYLNGFGDCKPLREEPANAYIVNRANDPGQLRPGDLVTIPEFVQNEESGGTEAVHNFVRRGTMAMLRFIHASSTTKVGKDPSLSFLNVSNYITNQAGSPDGSAVFPNSGIRGFNADADQDPDVFKVEVQDINASGELDVELEVLKPIYNAKKKVSGYERFPAAIRGPRMLSAKASKQGTTTRFWTCYLRLVVDDADKAVANDQTLLVSDIYDPNNAASKDVEILDQRVKASYTIKTCPMNPKCKSTAILPIGSDRRRLRVAVHVLRQAAGGAPIVSAGDAEKRILTWLRRSYAQMSIAPKLLMVREVDPPENLVAIANDDGLTAAGDGTLRFTITAAGHPSQTIGPFTPTAGATPLQTAQALAALVSAPFKAIVSENPERFNDPVGRKSADILITADDGARVVIGANTLSNDSRQRLRVARPNAMMFREWDGNNWLVGSIEQRAVLKNYDTGDDRFDLFVVQRFISPTLLGAAMMSGHIVDPQRRAISKVKWSCFVDRRSADGTEGFPFVIPHEAMHAVGEVMHAVSTVPQIMNPTAQAANGVANSKRVRDGAVNYDGGTIAGNHNLVTRMRQQGGSLMENW
jgi:hypothetical protein